MGLRFDIDPAQNAQRMRAVMDGALYYVTAFYVRRAGAWFLHLDNASGTRLLSGVRLASMVDILGPYKARPGVPQGFLQLLGSAIPPRDPSRDEVGDTFELFYWFANPATQRSSSFTGAASSGGGGGGGGGGGMITPP